MKIMTDTSALYSHKEGEALGLEILSLSVTINNKTYKEFEEIQPEEFIEIIEQGHMPVSSQPPIGETIEVLEKYEGEDVIILNMADGLSGTYQSTVSARNSIDGNEHMHVINTKTLCGPHRYLVNLALSLKDKGCSTEEIIDIIYQKMEFTKSFLIPIDFKFLQKGGRLSPLAAKIGGMLKIIPVLELTKDGRSLDKYTIKKTEKGALKSVIKCFKEMGVNKTCLISVTHAGVPAKAAYYKEILQDSFPDTEIEIIELSPVFITHGGPGCIAIQMIGK